MRGHGYLNTLELLTGQLASEQQRKSLVQGASELDLVRSGLYDTMRMSFQDIREVIRANPTIDDYRTAAFAIAITKIAQSYYDLGLVESSKR